MGFEYDKVTYFGIMNNPNYRERLEEAYNYIKSLGIETPEDFTSRQGLKVGAFTYYEITIFDRIRDEKYRKSLEGPVDKNDQRVVDMMEYKDFGDRLASWGRVGKTPYRQELIDNGYVVNGMTPEEAAKHFKM